MKRNTRKIWNLMAAAAFIALPFLPANASAETRVVRLAKQYGISYLPLAIIEDKGLIESEGKKLGLDLRTEWTRFTGGPPMNEALISGNLDFATGGSGPLITAWARTKNNIKIKGICALNSMPQWLNTTNPNVKTIKDFTEMTVSPFPPCAWRCKRSSCKWRRKKYGARTKRIGSTNGRCRSVTPTVSRNF